MNLTRRTMLGTGLVALPVGLAGCIAVGPFPGTRLSVSVREPFEPEPPTSVPLVVEAYVQNVESKDVALRGVELVLCDDERERMASRSLGDLSWLDADPEQRETSEHDGWIGTTTAYSADWTLERTIEVDEVPRWLTFRVEEVWFGDDDAGSGASIVGTARATSPGPEFAATIRRFDPGDTPPSIVDDEDYASIRITRGVGEGSPLLPTPTPSPTPVNETATNQTTAEPTATNRTTAEPTATNRTTAEPTATERTDGD